MVLSYVMQELWENLEQEENIQEGKNGFYQLKCSSGFQDNKIGITKTPSLRAGNSSTYVKAGNFYYRKLTPLECERLQTVPDNYTEGVSNSQRYKMLGNGWTVDVIAHIFKGLE
jgi:site-specific DNA-cytosine methylase